MMTTNNWNSLKGHMYKGYKLSFGVYNYPDKRQRDYAFIKIEGNYKTLMLKKYFEKLDFDLYDMLLKEGMAIIDFIKYQADEEFEKLKEKEKEDNLLKHLSGLLDDSFAEAELTEDLDEDEEEEEIEDGGHDWVVPPYERNEDGDLVEVEDNKKENLEPSSDSVSDWFNSTDLNRYLV